MMPYMRIDPITNKVLGRVRSKLDENCIEVSDEMFGRILGDVTAFEYDPQTGQIDLVSGYSTIQPSHDPAVLAQFAAEVVQNLYVPELGVDVSVSGEFGAHLLFALACAAYSPQTIVCSTQGRISTITIDSEAAKHIANAMQARSLSILNTLGVSDEPTD